MKEIVFDEAAIRKALQIPEEVPIIFKDNSITVKVVPTPIKEVPLGKWFRSETPTWRRNEGTTAKRVESIYPILHGNLYVKEFDGHNAVYSKLSKVDVYVEKD